MINRIGINVGVNRIVFRADEQNLPAGNVENNTFVEPFQGNKGLDALAAYNAAIVKKPILQDELKVEPLIPIVINPENVDKMEGERIYSSDGDLHSIVRRDENTYTVFTPSKDDENKFNVIKTYDKKTGNIIILQENSKNYDGKECIEIREFDSKTGDSIRYSEYLDGDIAYARKTTKDKFGKEHDVTFFYDDKTYRTTVTYPNGNRSMSAYFDENKQLINFSEYDAKKAYSTNTDIDFYHGAPTSISITKNMTMPNIIGWETFVNSEYLKPSANFEKIEHIKDIEGERTYYSNGALESNKFNSESGVVTAYFNPDGTCENIKSDNKEIFFSNNGNTIKETLENGKFKETKFLKNNAYRVKIYDDKTYQELSITDKNKPLWYSEGIIQDHQEKETKWLSFDDNGMLEYGRDYIV